MEYGTGAIMAVPAHDQRDFDFARQHGVPVRVVIQPDGEEPLDGDTMSEAYAGEGLMAKSRWSCAGTAMIAPVPYSMSTYGATKHGTFSPFTGFTACTPSATPSFVSAASRCSSGVARTSSSRGSPRAPPPPRAAAVAAR